MENVNLWNLNPELSKFESDLNSIIETIKKEKITYIKVIDEEVMEVPMDIILDAACNVNKEVFNLSYEQTTKLKEELLEDNLKREQKVFPYYLGENTTKKI